jgi:hypothetical protein
MMTMSEARAQPGVVLGADLNVGDEVLDLAHDVRWRVIEARRDFYGVRCVTVQNRYGGVLHYPVTTPFRWPT